MGPAQCKVSRFGLTKFVCNFLQFDTFFFSPLWDEDRNGTTYVN